MLYEQRLCYDPNESSINAILDHMVSEMFWYN